MHVLIIGCGYLGLRAAKAWRQNGVTVSALTRSSDRVKQWQEMGLQPIVGDVLDVASLQSLPSADLCLYAVGYDRSAGVEKQTVYVDGLRNVLSELSTRVPRLIYISSTSVYGQDHGETVDENSPCEPTTEGGRICLEAEQLVRGWQQEHPEKSATILRLAGIYGPARMLARLDQLRAGAPLTGNADAWLNLIHVDDAVQAILKLAHRAVSPPCRLLCDEKPLRRREFYSALAASIGAPEPTFVAGGETGLNKRCDSSALRKEIDLELLYPDALTAIPSLSADL